MNKKNLQVGDLVYFDTHKDGVGIIVGFHSSSPDIELYDVFWFKTLKYKVHSYFYLHKVKKL